MTITVTWWWLVALLVVVVPLAFLLLGTKYKPDDLGPYINAFLSLALGLGLGIGLLVGG